MNSPIRTKSPSLPLLILAAIFASCSGDPAPKQAVHFHHPMLSNDNAFLFAGYEEYTEGQEAPGSSPNFVVKTLATGAISRIYLPKFTAWDRYWIEPVNSSIVLLAAADTIPGFRFHFRNGDLLGVYSLEKFGVVPQAISFDPDGGSFLWAGASGGRVKIGRTTYGTQPWKPADERVLVDTTFDANVHDVCYTSGVTYAFYLSDGTVREYNMSAALLHLWRLEGREFEDSWQARLQYKESLGQRRLFTLDDSGIVKMDILTHQKSVITAGQLKLFDVSKLEISDLMAYETRTGDVWIAYIDGQLPGLPRNRLRKQHAPFFSRDGSLLATVGRVDAWTDTLAARKSPFML